jgi:PAS domain S-box-containing protein
MTLPRKPTSKRTRPSVDGQAAAKIEVCSFDETPGIRPLPPLPTASDYRTLVVESSAQLALFEFTEPIPTVGKKARDLGKLAWEHSSRCIEANDNFLHAHGCSRRDEVLGQPLERFFERSEQHLEMFEAWAAGGFALREFQLPFKHHKRGDLVLRLSIYPAFQGTTVTKIWLACHDITELIQAVDALQRAEVHYRTLVERPGFIVLRSTSDGRFVYLSPELQEIVGFPSERFIESAEFIRTLLHPDDIERFEAVAAEMKRNLNQPLEREYRLLCKDGTYHWFFERVHPSLKTGGEVEYYDSILLDIEDRKRLELALHHAQRMEVVGTLAGGIAHDFNNHLTAILGQITLVREDLGAGHPGHQSLMSAEHAALSCSEMTRELLQFSRKSEPHRSPIPISVILDSTAQLVKLTLPSSLAVSVKHDAPGIGVMANAAQLQQVLMNLVVNSRDAMPKGGTIAIATRPYSIGTKESLAPFPEAKKGSYVQISVTDTGQGIPANHIPHLFEPFFTTKAPGRGTGLGLSSVYSIVKNHDGYIAVTSELGRGTTFSIILPACVATPQCQESLLPSATWRGSEGVLIADDDAMVRDMLKAAFTMQGYSVMTANDGVEALEILDKHSGAIRLLVLDQTMPKLSGREVLDELQLRLPNLPVLFSSGHPSEDILARIPSNSKMRFLPKPFVMSDLYRLARELLDGSKDS